MAKAKKLKSGSWNVLVYSHTDETGKRRYESFTAPTKKEAEYMAAAYKMERDRLKDVTRLSLGEAIDRYIEQKSAVLSPDTIDGYKKIRRTAFQSIMDVSLRKIDDSILQEAVYAEMRRPSRRGGQLSAKSIKNAYGLIISVLGAYLPGNVFRVDLPKSPRRIRSLPEPGDIWQSVRGDKIELAVLLAMWLSLTESEIRGLTKSGSIDGEYLTVRSVMIRADGRDIVKSLGKTDTRIRRHHLPPYIRQLIDQVDGDVLCPFCPSVFLRRLHRCMDAAGLPRITFHDLRHVSASVMAVLQIPDIYAQERGGWKTDHIMKQVYMETFRSERQRADTAVDSYFEMLMQNEMQDNTPQS